MGVWGTGYAELTDKFAELTDKFEAEKTDEEGPCPQSDTVSAFGKGETNVTTDTDTKLCRKKEEMTKEKAVVHVEEEEGTKRHLQGR